jgi:hypothetical protein
MDRLAHLKRELERRFPTVEAVREQAPDANEFAGEVEDHKIYELGRQLFKEVIGSSLSGIGTRRVAARRPAQ